MLQLSQRNNLTHVFLMHFNSPYLWLPSLHSIITNTASISTEQSKGTILCRNEDDFTLIRELECWSLLLNAWPKFLDNCRISKSYGIYSWVIETPCLNGPGLVWTVLATMLSKWLSKISSRLSLYRLSIGSIYA